MFFHGFISLLLIPCLMLAPGTALSCNCILRNQKAPVEARYGYGPLNEDDSILRFIAEDLLLAQDNETVSKYAERSLSNHTNVFVPSKGLPHRDRDYSSSHGLGTELLFIDRHPGRTTRNLDEVYRSIRQNLDTPLIDPAEIRIQQEIYKELLTDTSLHQQLAAWNQNYGYIHGSVEQQKNAKTYFDFERLDPNGDNSRHVWGYHEMFVNFTALLPAIQSASELLKGSKNVRFHQLRLIAESVLRSPEFVRDISKIKEISDQLIAGLIDVPSSEARTTELLKEGSSLILRYAQGSRTLQKLFYVGEELNSKLALTDFVLRKGWATFPKILERDPEIGPIVRIVNGHHPILPAETEGESIANSVRLGGSDAISLLVSGPNDEGKSHFTRMIGLLVTLAQMGLPVPADFMELTPLSIYYHVRPADSPSKKMGAFVNQSQALYRNISSRLSVDPFQLILTDESSPGTVSVLATKAERTILKYIASTGALTINPTHNEGTQALEKVFPGDYANVHIDQRRIVDGPMKDLQKMTDGAARGLRRAGWAEEMIQEFLQDPTK